MKRIVFLTNLLTDNLRARVRFIVRMLIKGILVLYVSPDSVAKLEKNTLYVVDSLSSYKKIKGLGGEALVYIKYETEMDSYPEAKYFVLDAEDTELEYFDRVYKRTVGEPWIIAETERLILRETIESDIDAFYEMYQNPLMTLYTEGLYKDKEEEKRYLKEYREKVYAPQGFGVWTVLRKSDGRVIGRAGLSAREGFDNYEIGFAIGCDYQRQGYAKEAVRAILEFANSKELGPINALVMKDNVASKGLLMSTGFEKNSETVLDKVAYEVWVRNP